MDVIPRYIRLLDQQRKDIYIKKIDAIFSEIESKFSKPTEHLPNGLIKLDTAIGSEVAALVSKGWGDIYWDEVLKFKYRVFSKIDKYITAIFDDRVKLATDALEQVIAFYNDFLERQERYQQETPEQRQAEKNWIDQQRQELTRVKMNIEAILNAG